MLLFFCIGVYVDGKFGRSWSGVVGFIGVGCGSVFWCSGDLLFFGCYL